MADTDWEFYRPELERLYVHERKTLPKVMEYMASKYDFTERKSQYEKYFGQWGLRKYQPLTPSEGKFIGKRVEKRKREDQKDSEVHVRGVPYPPGKLKKSKYNQTFLSTVDRLPGAPSPDTPEGIVVCTPATPGMHLFWNESLPWLRFSQLLKPGRKTNIPSLPSMLAVASPNSPSALTNNVNPALMQRLYSIVPWKRLSHPPNINSHSRLKASLSILMPEESKDQHLAMATRLCSTQRTTVESMTLELFLLSNNLVAHGVNGRSEESMIEHDSNVMKLFRTSGWNDMKHIEVLLSSKEPTAEAIAEKLFASALRLGDAGTVQMMLKARIEPNSRVDTFHHGPLTCLQLAADMGTEMIELLLSHGANIDLSYNDYPPLYYAIEGGDEEAISLFLSRGAIVTPSCLAAAVCLEDVKLFREIIDRVNDVSVRSGWQDPSALELAVKHRKLPFVKLLLARGADINTLSTVDFDGNFDVTTVLGHAVRTKNLDIILAILQACTDVNPRLDGLPYVSPLALAVWTNDTQIVRILLQAGVNATITDEGWEITVLERALKRKNVEICHLLIQYGAGVHMPQSDKQRSSSALLIAVQNNCDAITNLLIQAGTPLNEVYSDAPGTVLAAAVEKGDLRLIHTLESFGAFLIGSKLRSIGSLDTAMYLQERGILQDVLDTCGVQILTAALLCQNLDLAQWLLAHKIDVDGNSTGIDPCGPSGPPTTPLQAAIHKNKLPFVDALVARGARVTDCDLAEAVGQENISLLRHLLTGFLGSAPTAVGCAIFTEQPEAIQLILEAGADPTGTPQLISDRWLLDEDSEFDLQAPQSVLEIAAQSGDRSILQVLLKSCLWDQRLTGRALAIAIIFDHIHLVDDFLELEVDLNQEVITYHRDTYDENDEPVIMGGNETLTPLQAAAKGQHVHTVESLVKCPNTDINYLGEGVRRRTALQHAVESGNMDLVNLLLDHGADINSEPAKDGGATALQIAAIQGYLGIARKLINLDADVNAAPARRNGRTALEGAAEYGRIDMLRMIIDEDASLVGEDGERQFERAVKFAVTNGHNAAANLLRSSKVRVEESP